MTRRHFVRILDDQPMKGSMNQEKGKVHGITDVSGDYRLLEIHCPKIAETARPGQFVHVLVPRLDGSVLRRPFSIFSAENGNLSIVFKIVGRGTHVMGHLESHDELSVIGPLGNGFPDPAPYKVPILVAGGYGVAPLLYLAQYTGVTGIAFAGGRTEQDLLFASDFEDLGWEVVLATDDGSKGMKGVVTDAVRERLSGNSENMEPEFFACGPDGMLRAISSLVIEGGWTGWMSLDKHMGCGIGACLACVQRIRASDGSTSLKRVCKDGPIFESREIVWSENDEA